MRTTLLWTTGLARSAVPARLRALAHDDRGEGVISAAIAVCRIPPCFPLDPSDRSAIGVSFFQT